MEKRSTRDPMKMKNRKKNEQINKKKKNETINMKRVIRKSMSNDNNNNIIYLTIKYGNCEILCLHVSDTGARQSLSPTRTMFCRPSTTVSDSRKITMPIFCHLTMPWSFHSIISLLNTLSKD